jgi:prophage tail gpP-like protein
MPNLSLKINGRIYSGWTSLRVVRSLEQLAHKFNVTMTERWAGKNQDIPIQRGQNVVVTYTDDNGKQTDVVTGFIDENVMDYDDKSKSMSITGRSFTGDLVDCSVVTYPSTWKKNTDPMTIILAVVKPFGLSVSVGAGITKPVPFEEDVSVHIGESAFQFLEKICRLQQLVMTTDGTGNLVLTQSTNAKQVPNYSLVFGKNILKCHRSDSFVERFSQYIVKSQKSARGIDGDTFYGKNCSQTKASTDDEVAVSGAKGARYRPTIIQAESGTTGQFLLKRADWERNVRAGKANRVTYTVDGWEHPSGLWEPNTLVHVKDPQCQFDDSLLIVTVTFTRDEGGTHTELELAQPGAYAPQPLEKPRTMHKHTFELKNT